VAEDLLTHETLLWQGRYSTLVLAAAREAGSAPGRTGWALGPASAGRSNPAVTRSRNMARRVFGRGLKARVD
jgi:hypothetical protein